MFIDGFEHYGYYPSGVLGGESGAMRASGYVVEGQPRIAFGRNAAMPNSAAVNCPKNAALWRTFAWNNARFATGACVRKATDGSVLWVRGAGETAVIWIEPDERRPLLNNVKGFPTLADDEWHFFELVLDRDTGLMEMWINGDLEVTTATPASLATAKSVEVGFGSLSKSTFSKIVNMTDAGEAQFDDFYVDDGTRRGPLLILTREPSSLVDIDPDTNWRGLTPAANSQNLTQRPLNLAKRFNYHDKSGVVDTYRLHSTPEYQKAPIAQATVALLRMSAKQEFRVEISLNGVKGGKVSASHKPLADWSIFFAQHGAFQGESFADYQNSTLTLKVTG